MVTALAAATLILVLTNLKRLSALRESMDAGANAFDIFMVAIAGAILALAAVIVLGTVFGSF